MLPTGLITPAFNLSTTSLPRLSTASLDKTYSPPVNNAGTVSLLNPPVLPTTNPLPKSPTFKSSDPEGPFAKDVGFDQCYLETMPYMDDARKLYRKFGFKSIDQAMGDTGHYSCSVWMLKDL